MNELITIQRTDEYKKTKFGLLGNISDNGCGAIAAYNILNFEGIDMSLKNTIRGLRRCLGLLFGMGKLGTNLFALKAYLMKFFTVRLGIIPLINHRFSDSPSSAVIFTIGAAAKKSGHTISLRINAKMVCTIFIIMFADRFMLSRKAL